jgi:prepilin-type N-terminal cleavage/methylation domain-containing protein
MDNDEGLTLIEVLVAIAVVGIVMTALTSFFVTSLAALHQQSTKQAAVQVADGATELVRAVKASSVLTGRDKSSSDTQWASPVTGVSGYLADMQETWDSTATTGAGATATLPTTATSTTVNGITFGQSFYVGQCWQPGSGGDCVATSATGSVAFLRVVVAVTWTCRTGACSYVTSTLVNTLTDPLFNSNDVAQAPAVETATTQTGEVSVAASLQFAASGGAPPLTWSATGLPGGLSMDSSGLVTGTPTTAGTYPATVTVTDARLKTGSAGVSWTVNALPALTNPGSQATAVGAAVSLTVASTGGTAPLAWTATGLPAGLSIAGSTGVVSGTPTTTRTAATVTVTATDAASQPASTTFTWAVIPAVTTPAAQTGEVSVAASALQVVVSGGVSPYAWTASGLPAGLSIGASTGLVSGTPTASGTSTVTVTVTDANGASATTSGFTWTVAAVPAVTLPTTTARSSPLGTTITSVQATVSGGTSAYTWSATNLPTGLSISGGGLISGKPTAGTRFLPTVTVTDAKGVAASVTFVWSVTTGSALQVTAPTTDRTDTKGTSPTVTGTASGGTGTKTWTATGLPPGASLNSGTGAVTGTLTTKGTYTVTLTVTDSASAKAVSMFVWTVQ